MFGGTRKLERKEEANPWNVQYAYHKMCSMLTTKYDDIKGFDVLFV